MAARYDDALAPFGIGVAQFSMLRSVERGGPLPLTELGHRLELDRSTVGRNVRVLQKMGLLMLGRGKDQREALVALTAQGRETLAAAFPIWERVQEEMEERLGEADATALRQTLQAL